MPRLKIIIACSYEFTTIPAKVASCEGQSAWVVFKNEPPGSLYENIEVAFPFNFADIKIESFLVLVGHFLQQTNRIITKESPLMRRKKLQCRKS
jgi:hypothetical protein